MKILKLAAAGALCLTLWACFLSPGRFQASLDLRRDGSFTYRYNCEILLLTPHSLLSMGAEAAALDAVFDPKSQKCYGDPPGEAKAKPDSEEEEETVEDLLEDEAQVRECTPEEIEQRRIEWEKKRAEEKAQFEAMRGFFGGLDPKDPKTVAEFTRRLMTYQGWKKVVHKGEGVFDVQYEVSGRMDRDFLFPVFPEIEAVIPFVQANRRADGTVRIVAPGFSQHEQLMSPGMLGAAAAMQTKAASPFTIVKPEGVFTLTTDGEILTNNTDNGPEGAAGGSRVLKWSVGPLDKKKPEALIRL